MNWNALKNGKCPMCNKMLGEHPKRPNFLRCTDPICTFQISEAKFVELTKPRAQRQQSTEFMSDDDRMSELNNYGRTVYDPDEPPREW
jgi:hypothetical protein